MINYHVLTSPVYLGLYHQFDSISSTPNHVGSTQRTSFQGVSYQADASRSQGVPTKGIKRFTLIIAVTQFSPKLMVVGHHVFPV